MMNFKIVIFSTIALLVTATIDAHHGFLSRSRVKKHNLTIPADLINITIVE